MHASTYKNIYFSLSFAVLFVLFSFSGVYAQHRSKIYEDYIDKYSDVAVEHMERYKIPASIKLAQGLLGPD